MLARIRFPGPAKVLIPSRIAGSRRSRPMAEITTGALLGVTQVTPSRLVTHYRFYVVGPKLAHSRMCSRINLFCSGTIF